MAPLVAEAAARLEKNEGGHEKRADGVEQSPVHRRQQAARSGLPLTLGMCQALRSLQNLPNVRSSAPAVRFPAMTTHFLCCVRCLVMRAKAEHGSAALKTILV